MANCKVDKGIYALEHKDAPSKCRKWKIVVSHDYKQVSRTVRGTLTQAREEKKKLTQEAEKGIDLSKANITFAEYAESWEKRRADSGNYAPATLTDNKTTLNKFVPLLGRFKLAKIKPHVINDAMQTVRETPAHGISQLSNATMRKHYCILFSLFEDAVKEEAITSNPMAKTEKPKRDTKPRKSLEPAQYTALFTEALESEPNGFNNALVLAMGFGLRRGECLGLQWGDVDFMEGTITVARSYDARTGKTKAPKTATSCRTIPAIDGAMDYLRRAKAAQREYLASLGMRQTKSTPVCINAKGGYINTGTLYYQFGKYSKAHGLNLVWHELRHTYATLLCGTGCDIVTASKLMGHSGTETLTKVYAHVLDENKRAAAVKLSKMVARQSAAERGEKVLKIA